VRCSKRRHSCLRPPYVPLPYRATESETITRSRRDLQRGFGKNNGRWELNLPLEGMTALLPIIPYQTLDGHTYTDVE